MLMATARAMSKSLWTMVEWEGQMWVHNLSTIGMPCLQQSYYFASHSPRTHRKTMSQAPTRVYSKCTSNGVGAMKRACTRSQTQVPKQTMGGVCCPAAEPSSCMSIHPSRTDMVSDAPQRGPAARPRTVVVRWEPLVPWAIKL